MLISLLSLNMMNIFIILDDTLILLINPLCGTNDNGTESTTGLTSHR